MHRENLVTPKQQLVEYGPFFYLFYIMYVLLNWYWYCIPVHIMKCTKYSNQQMLDKYRLQESVKQAASISMNAMQYKRYSKSERIHSYSFNHLTRWACRYSCNVVYASVFLMEQYIQQISTLPTIEFIHITH